MRARRQKMLQNFRNTEYAKSSNIWIIYTDDINQNILAVLRTLSNLQKKYLWKILHQGDNFQSSNHWIS